MRRDLGVVLLLVVVGCGRSHTPASGDIGTDARFDESDFGADASLAADATTLDANAADADLQQCGDDTCSADEHCCATCAGEPNVCVPLAYDCPVADEFDCTISNCPPETDVGGAAVGDCDTVLGYRWEGIRCVPLSGCSCTGTVCSELFSSLDDCEAAHVDCRLCGTVLEVPCDVDEFCRHTGPIDRCTRLDDLWGICVPIPEQCEPDESPVCACGGVTYDNPCLARAARQTVDHLGPCNP